MRLVATKGMEIAGIGCASAPYRYDTQAMVDKVHQELPGCDHTVVEQLSKAVSIKHRHLGQPIEDYKQPVSVKALNDIYLHQGTIMGIKAINEALAKVGLTPRDVDCILTTSTTGIATPPLDCRIANQIGFRSDIKRFPMFGLGCCGGAAGIARMNDYLTGHPNDVAVLLSVEFCSLTGSAATQLDDPKVSDLIGFFLFGDGAAAVVGLGSERAKVFGGTRRPRVVHTESQFYPNTERLMAWDVGDSGWGLVLHKGLPDLVKREIPGGIDRVLHAVGISRSDIEFWVCHPGGPKILRNIEEAFDLPPAALQRAWTHLESFGNMSSASILHILRDTLDSTQSAPPRGSYGLMLAMGPGFCSEIVVLQW